MIEGSPWHDPRELVRVAEVKGNMLKVSIITAVLNNFKTLECCIISVLSQLYRNIEHIIIDGGSSDGTLDVIKEYKEEISYWVSEQDNGIYDAMNKGIRAATGDVIGILNSDDVYTDEFVIENIVKCLSEDNVPTCYGDLVYVDQNDPSKIVRVWKSCDFSKEKFKRGWMPPHPTFFVKKHVYEQYGVFNLDFPLAADYELMLRFLYKYNVSTAYVPKVLVKMRTGGTCRPGFLNTPKNVIENYKAWKINELNPNPVTFLLKPLSKAFQYINRR